MSNKTKVFEGSFKGHPIFEIWPVEDNGTTGKYKVTSFGVTKAKAILAHVEELKAFIAKHDEGGEGAPAKVADIPGFEKTNSMLAKLGVKDVF